MSRNLILVEARPASRNIRTHAHRLGLAESVVCFIPTRLDATAILLPIGQIFVSSTVKNRPLRGGKFWHCPEQRLNEAQ